MALETLEAPSAITEAQRMMEFSESGPLVDNRPIVPEQLEKEESPPADDQPIDAESADSAEGGGEGDQTAEEGAEAEGQAPESKEKEGEEEQKEPESTEKDTVMSEMKQLLSDMKEKMATLEQAVAQRQAEATAVEEAAKAEYQPVDFDLTPEEHDAAYEEDPKGLKNVLNKFGASHYKQIMERVEEETDKKFQKYDARVMDAINQATALHVQSYMFYELNPDLKDHMKDVGAEIQRIANADPNKPYSDMLAEAAENVRNKHGMKTPKRAGKVNLPVTFPKTNVSTPKLKAKDTPKRNPMLDFAE